MSLGFFRRRPEFAEKAGEWMRGGSCAEEIIPRSRSLTWDAAAFRARAYPRPLKQWRVEGPGAVGGPPPPSARSWCGGGFIGAGETRPDARDPRPVRGTRPRSSANKTHPNSGQPPRLLAVGATEEQKETVGWKPLLERAACAAPYLDDEPGAGLAGPAPQRCWRPAPRGTATSNVINGHKMVHLERLGRRLPHRSMAGGTDPGGPPATARPRCSSCPADTPRRRHPA